MSRSQGQMQPMGSQSTFQQGYEGQMHPPGQYGYAQPAPPGFRGFTPDGPLQGWQEGHTQGSPGQHLGSQTYSTHNYPPQQQAQQQQSMPPPGNPAGQAPPQGWTSFHPAASAPPNTRREALQSIPAAPGLRTMPPPSLAGGTTSNDLGAPSGEKAGPSEFIKKLYNMLEDESVQYGLTNGIKNEPGKKAKGRQERGAVGWGRGGQTFVVWEMNDFTTKVLPHTFRHSNFSSFVRQLNKYGFSKIKHTDESTGQIKENVWEFQHTGFLSGGRTDLDSIKRKTAAPKKVLVATEPPALLTTAKVNPHSSPGGGVGARSLPVFDNGMAWMENKLLALEERVRRAEEAANMARSREADWRSMIGEMVGYLVTTEQDHLQGASGLLHQYNSIHRRHCGEPRGVQSHVYAYQPSPASSSSYQGQHMFYQGPETFGSNGGGKNSHSHISPAASAASGSGSGQSQVVSPKVEEVSGSSKRSAGLEGTLNAEAYHSQQGAAYASYPGRPRGISIFDEQGMPFNEPYNGGDQWGRKESMGTQIRNLLARGAGMEEDGQDPLDTSPRNETITTGLTPSATTSPFGVLELPDEASRQTQVAVDRLRRSTIIPSWTTPPRVLVVEDDLVYRQLSRKFLEKFGCEIETVEDASQALEKMNERKFDLVLMDIFLGPSMDGRKATSLIRQFDSLTPIISMTSNAQPNDVISYLEHGMTDVLAKPFTKRGLFTILEKHLIHLKSIQQLGDIPRFIGVPPLSDSGVIDAVANGAAQLISTQTNTTFIRNPLAGMGFNDETYRLMLQNYIAVGANDRSSVDLSVLLPQGSDMWQLQEEKHLKRGVEEIEDDTEREGSDNKKQRQVEVG